MRFLLFFFVSGWCAFGASAATLYVSPNGNDAWSGLAASPNAARTNGPLLTLAGAQKKWRALPDGEKRHVLLRGGDYPLDATVVLDAQDKNLEIEAFAGEHPRLIGANQAQWRNSSWNGRRAFVADFTDDVPLQALYVNGKRALRARWPKVGTLQLKDAGSNGKQNWGEPGTDHFSVQPTDWANMGDASGAEVVALHFWVESRLPVETFNAQSGEIVSSRKTVAPLDWGYKGVPAPYYIENARGALRESGEWIDDVAKHQLVYLPREGETLANARLNAPLLSQLLRVDGAGQDKIAHVRFSNIGFCESAATMPFAGTKAPDKAPAGSGQAAVDVGGSVEVSHADDVTFAGCDFSGLGWSGLQISDGSENILVARCGFHDLGAGALQVNGADTEGALWNRTDGVQVLDCTMQGGGRVWPSAVAVLLRHASNCVVAHDAISDFYYTGISCGWSWGYGPSVAKNNLISHNHIWNIGQGVLSDMGGVYLLGLAPGTRVENNWIHDVRAANYGGWGVYLDEGSSGVEVKNNVVARCSQNSFHQHYGQNNTIENNIFMGGGNSVIARTRVEDHLSFSLKNNILVSIGSPIYSGALPDAAKNLNTSGNLVWNINGDPKATGKEDWSAWQIAGGDAGSRVADPLFVDVTHDNFDFLPHSPAIQMGFVPWNWREVGPRF